MKEVSVKEALRAGKRDVLAPTAVILYLAFLILSLLFAFAIITWWMALAGFFIACVASAYVHADCSRRWKIWAFATVQNTFTLQKEARNELILIPFFEEIFPPSKEVQSRLNALPPISPPTEDGFVDDPRIPESLEFFYSRSYNLLQLTMWSIALCVMSYITVGLALTGMLADEIGIALVLGFLVLLCLYCSVENIFQLRDTRPQLVLSSKGLKIKRQFFNKKHIKDVTVARTPKGGRVISVSIHNVWLGWTEDIRDLDVDHDKLEDIVEVFKGRWRAETENELAPTKTGQV